MSVRFPVTPVPVSKSLSWMENTKADFTVIQQSRQLTASPRKTTTTPSCNLSERCSCGWQWHLRIVARGELHGRRRPLAQNSTSRAFRSKGQAGHRCDRHHPHRSPLPPPLPPRHPALLAMSPGGQDNTTGKCYSSTSDRFSTESRFLL